jgi:steroid 5-alpha reductase family enzyme
MIYTKMNFLSVYIHALMVILAAMTVLWIVSVIARNVSIVDYFWGPGFLVSAVYYYFNTGGNEVRKIILLSLVTIWSLRLAIYLMIRNHGKGEDFRYREFRKKYGEHRYWWVSYFQVFLLQGLLMWLISVPLLGAQYSGKHLPVSFLDFAGIAVWITGFIFEAGGDLQLARFKADPSSKGKVLDKGLWRYTRHPNYFGDSAVWWGYGLICLAAGSYIPVLGSLMMTALIIKVSGVNLLEKSLKEQKPEYREYIRTTSAFFPWFPKKQLPETNTRKQDMS